MKLHIRKYLNSTLVAASTLLLLVSCNKDLPKAEPILPPTAPSNQTITDILADPQYSILRAAITKAAPASTSGLTPLSTLFSDKTVEYTFFAPNDAAFQASGIASAAVINSSAFSAGRLDTLLRYHLVGGQRLNFANSPVTPFPNLQLPTQLVLAPPSSTLPPGLRMSIFPSKQSNGIWVNNIPVVQADIPAANGIIHRVATLVAPPSQFLWQRIDTATDLTYLRAAIKRADEGVEAASTLEAALMNPAANLTVFAPVDAAFRQLLTLQITAALMAQGLDQATATAQATFLASTPAVFTNPALASVLSPTNVKGLVVYHILGNRAFTVNIPTTPITRPTLLNTAIPTHPGVTLQATFGATGVSAATVKGAANATASNFLINPTPSSTRPNAGTSDQHYINGVLHKIDQVLRPQ